MTEQQEKEREERRQVYMVSVHKVIRAAIELARISERPITTSNVIKTLNEVIDRLNYTALQANPEDYLDTPNTKL